MLDKNRFVLVDVSDFHKLAKELANEEITIVQDPVDIEFYFFGEIYDLPSRK